jgi:hypothetical protein
MNLKNENNKEFMINEIKDLSKLKDLIFDKIKEIDEMSKSIYFYMNLFIFNYYFLMNINKFYSYFIDLYKIKK